jgi:ABC-2 type transport system permease protein
MNRILLYLIMLPTGLYTRLGADPGQLRAILDIKLKLDDRKPVNLGRPQKQKKARRFSIFLGMLIAFLTGLIYVFPLVIMHDRLTALWLFFTMFLFLLSFTLISDFSTVLIDTRDKYVILPRPVSDRTLFLSRTLHIFLYLFRIVLPMSIPGWIVLGIMDGWKAVLFFPLPLLLLVFTALFIVMGVYLLMLRAASAEKFKEILSYFQIAFSVIVFATYYLVPRAMDAESMKTFNVTSFPWARFTPPYWLASTFSWIDRSMSGGTETQITGLFAIALPVFCIWITVKYLAPQFASRLGSLDAIESGDTNSSQKRRNHTGSTGYQRLAHLLNSRPEAQAGFIMAWIQTARSRTFKMKVYPMFAYVPIYFIYLMLQSKKPLSEVYESLPGSASHLVLLYMCSVVMLQAFAFMGISEQYKAAWIYRAVPLAEPGAIMSGSFKVVWVKYFLPFFTAVSIFVLVVWGMPALSDILLALVNITLFAACVVRVSYRRFPFSEIDQTASSGSKFLRALIGMSIPAALGIGHYFAMDLLWLKSIFLVLSSILLWLVWDSYAHTGWEALKAEEV